MKKIILLVMVCATLANCYLYQPMDKEIAHEPKNNSTVDSTQKIKKIKSEKIILEPQEAIKEMKKLEYYKIKMATNKQYKIRFDCIVNDTIIGHKKHNKEAFVKLSKDSVTEVRERQFKKTQTDLITYGFIGTAAAIISLLLFN